MKNSLRQTVAATALHALLSLSLFFTGAFVNADAIAETLVFTAIPDQDERALQQRFGKIADYLARELKQPVRNVPMKYIAVKYIPVKSYAAAVTAFRNKQVQLAWFGGLSGVQARRLSPGARAIAQGIEDVQFKSYFIAHQKTGLQAADKLPDSIRQKSFTFGPKDSTSGRLMPEFYLREQFKQSPEQLFSRVGFSGDHHKTIELVSAGVYEIGVVNYAVWDRDLAEGNIDTGRVQVIWTTPTYPDYQWTVRGDADQQFGAGFTERLQQALLAMTDPQLLAVFPRSGFIKAHNSDYAAIEVTAQAIGIMDGRRRIEGE